MRGKNNLMCHKHVEKMKIVFAGIWLVPFVLGMMMGMR